MQMTIGEVVDRLTIEQRKKIYGCDNDAVLTAIERDLRQRFGPEVAELVMTAGALGVVNDAIAVCEWQIRDHQDLSVEEIGKRALIIRELNTLRVEAKNNLSAAFEEPTSPVYYGIGGNDIRPAIQEPVRS